MNSFLWSLVLFWAIIYAIRTIKSSSSSQSFLPSPAARPSDSKSHLSKGKTLEISVRNFHLEIRSSALNASHDSVIEYFERKEKRAWIARSVARGFYNVGVVFGVLGFLVGVGVLGYSSGKFLFSRLGSPSQGEVKTQHFVKRDVETSAAVEKSGSVVNPIIPGVTVPWSHLPSILISLFTAQCFHEAGHATAGALEGLPLQAFGASLTVALPSAFVAFASNMGDLSAAARLRVIASGAWHNLVLCALLYLASFANATSIWEFLGWKSVSGLGLVVVEVEQHSPLVHHLQPGAIISSLDDLSLGGSEEPAEDVWSQYLLRSNTPSEQGWCIDVDGFFNQPTSCCHSDSTSVSSHPPAAQLSCFIPMQDGDQGHCIDPVPVMVSSLRQRCFSTSDCQKDVASGEPAKNMKECVRPNESAQLLRIGVSPPIWEMNENSSVYTDEVRIVLWSGPREEVWEQVKVGTVAPPYSFLPLWLPSATSTFFSYLSTLSLSLYIFNLFALPFLDGSHFLSALLDYVGDSRVHSYDAESDVELGERFEGPRKSTSNSLRRLHASVQRVSAWTWKWRRLIRRRKATIERAAKLMTITLMCTTVISMAWSA